MLERAIDVISLLDFLALLRIPCQHGGGVVCVWWWWWWWWWWGEDRDHRSGGSEAKADHVKNQHKSKWAGFKLQYDAAVEKQAAHETLKGELSEMMKHTDSAVLEALSKDYSGEMIAAAKADIVAKAAATATSSSAAAAPSD
jgi:hypothetical protein